MCKRNESNKVGKEADGVRPPLNLSTTNKTDTYASPPLASGSILKQQDLPTAEGKCPLAMSDLFWTKESYRYIAQEFHSFHRNDLNVLMHLFTTTLGVWGAIQTVLGNWSSASSGLYAVYIYALAVILTCPIPTGILHTVLIAVLINIPSPSLSFSLVAVISGYVLQDVAHYVMHEPTYLGAYIFKAPFTLFLHSLWLLPLVLDAVVLRSCFLPFLVPRNRVLFTAVEATDAIQAVRDWVRENVKEVKETTHIWPHQQEAIDKPVSALEMDVNIFKAFRIIFDENHYDILPVVPMNEVYVTAVGDDKTRVNSDKVFYTPHTDGPFWFTPGASLYRVLVGVTPNAMVRTRFNLQHSQDRVLDLNQALGFDYNKELHWIDHVSGESKPQERRTVLKLHYIVYPHGWKTYGKAVAWWNVTYNTWARNNFLATLRPASSKEHALAWWIWLSTWSNTLVVLNIGWWNLVYISAAIALGAATTWNATVLLTSYRHYALYITTFAYRNPPVAFGNLMRDAKLFKTLALAQLAYRIIPTINMTQDWPALCMVVMGFAITVSATAQLGFVRTYFGSELGFVKPQWVSGFPYSVIPHPMILGQLLAYATIAFWFGGYYDGMNRLGMTTLTLVAGHFACYTFHMAQEMCSSSY
jgi:hypothetical protein